MDEVMWRPGRRSWVDTDGTTWTRRRAAWLAERPARSFVLRESTLVAVERGGDADLLWLDPAARRGYWTDRVAGHLDDGSGEYVPGNDEGLTYRASVWTDDAARRLILLSAMC